MRQRLKFQSSLRGLIFQRSLFWCMPSSGSQKALKCVMSWKLFITLKRERFGTQKCKREMLFLCNKMTKFFCGIHKEPQHSNKLLTVIFLRRKSSSRMVLKLSFISQQCLMRFRKLIQNLLEVKHWRDSMCLKPKRMAVSSYHLFTKAMTLLKDPHSLVSKPWLQLTSLSN